MRGDVATKYINNLIFMPGWTITAYDYGYGQVEVRIDLETVNSNQDMARQGYPQKIFAGTGFVFDAEEFDGYLALYRWVLERIIHDVFTHEAREFLRVRPDLSAPFHPHRYEGDRNWDATSKLLTTVQVR